MVMEDNMTLNVSTMEMTINGEKVEIGKCDPTYGLNEELNGIYNKTSMFFAENNTQSEEEQIAILNIIQQILDSKDMSYVLKLVNIEDFICRLKDWDNNRNIISLQIFPSEKGQ
jgi:hypothetical protein